MILPRPLFEKLIQGRHGKATLGPRAGVVILLYQILLLGYIGLCDAILYHAIKNYVFILYDIILLYDAIYYVT